MPSTLFSAVSSLALPLLLDAAAVGAFPEVSVPTTCTAGFTAGRDVSLLTVPYPPHRVLEIVSNFQDLTWSGNPPNTVTLNGTNNEVGTARSYSLQGLDVVETLSEYYKPALTCAGTPIIPQFPNYAFDMVYVEAHTTAQVQYGSDKVYMPFDGLSVASTCVGSASILNYTTNYCATDVPTTQALLHTLHMQDLANVNAMLGNETFTSCWGLHTPPCF